MDFRGDLDPRILLWGLFKVFTTYGQLLPEFRVKPIMSSQAEVSV